MLETLTSNPDVIKLSKGEYSLSISDFYNVKMKITSLDNVILKNNSSNEINFIKINKISKYK